MPILYYIPRKKGMTLSWTKLNTLHPRMLCVNFRWNCHSGSGKEEKNVIFFNYDDDHGQRRHFSQKSSLAPSAQEKKCWPSVTKRYEDTERLKNKILKKNDLLKFM